MKLYILYSDSLSRIKRLEKILDKHRVKYSVIILVSGENTREFGGLLSSMIKHMKQSYRHIRDKLRKLGVKAKLYRKYANQRLEDLAHKHNIRLDAVNLIMSRELSVTGEHYLNTRDYADKLFSIYVEYLKERGLI